MKVRTVAGRDVEVEDVAVAFDGDDRIRIRLQELRHYPDTEIVRLVLSKEAWYRLVAAVNEAVGTPAENTP